MLFVKNRDKDTILPNHRTEHKRELSDELSAEACAFDDTHEITLFYKRNNKTTASIGLNLLRVSPVNCEYWRRIEAVPQR